MAWKKALIKLSNFLGSDLNTLNVKMLKYLQLKIFTLYILVLTSEYLKIVKNLGELIYFYFKFPSFFNVLLYYIARTTFFFLNKYNFTLFLTSCTYLKQKRCKYCIKCYLYRNSLISSFHQIENYLNSKNSFDNMDYIEI